ncbi:uncharacterized protein [Haliotis cracherodii]|uniref:uncharacterized protein n=1 Tax=Haliotis cracherodii TaxID=6455 RepID=UPI0039EC21A7
MPRRKKMPGIGQKKKHYKRKSSKVTTSLDRDHSHAQVNHHRTDDQVIVESSQDEFGAKWSEAWDAFYLGHGSGTCNNTSTEEPEEVDSDCSSANRFYVILHKVFCYKSHVDLDKFVEKLWRDRRFELFQFLKNDIKSHTDALSDFTISRITDDNIQLVQHYHGESPTVKLCMNIRSSLVPSLLVHKIVIDREHDIWTGLPKIVMSFGDLQKFFDRLKLWDVCVGNHEEEFTSTMPKWSTSYTKTNQVLAYHEADFCAKRDDIEYHSTIRSTKCTMLTVRKRCSHCSLYRNTLRKKISRSKQQESSFSEKKTTPHKHMSKDMMISKIKVMKDKTQHLQTELDKIRRSIWKSISVKGQKLNETDNVELLGLLKKHTVDVEKAFPDENSLQRLFWDQQLKCVSLTDRRQMKWHPMIIKWCLYIRSKSQKAYDATRDAGFISLPSSRTLFDYSHWLPAECGFNYASVSHLRNEAAQLGMFQEEWMSYVGILQDEVKVSEGLVYDRVTGELVGYVELEKTGNDLLHMENLIANTKKKLASSILVIMVRGITSSLKYPVACFATSGITADLLYPAIWKAVRFLEIECRLKILFVTCDGASPNRKFFNLHHCEELQNTYWTWNPYSYPRRKLYFISDVPHLLKTTRNCFANSGSHSKSRDMWKDGQDIRWSHIVRLYEEYVEPSIYAHAHKLTREHIDLTPFAKMKVNLAAQVLSKTVADALEHLYDDSVSETVNFIRQMNKFFDCLNTRNLNEADRKRNTNLREYVDRNDERLTYLTTEFLGYFDAWERAVLNRQGPLTKSQRSRMMLSKQTLHGLRITVQSIVECVRFLLDEGANFVLTHRFNQDPLEEHFSHYRQKGGANSNPTVYDVKHTMSQLRVIGSTALAPITGNITNKRGHNDIRVVHTPLTKRQRRN